MKQALNNTPEQVEGKSHNRPVNYWGCGLIGLKLITGGPMRARIVSGPTSKSTGGSCGFTGKVAVSQDFPKPAERSSELTDDGC
ncbi:uncharacterized protein N7500_000427 [Penicillium coprophilum]|uniref:uncharacterized protein n=1 Tax=Penicillium coprophilum TaxID=36646 RepID=UPI002385622D|nr:uncharacterized protein N7500_000427 [Penicillium coprophilum]KAJ5177728.1 hypothetical protein N7500_000427 [Penicillium coprophilum]